MPFKKIQHGLIARLGDLITMKQKRKKINYSVKRDMQVRLFIRVLCITLIGIGLMAVCFYFYSNREMNNSFRMFHIHAENFLEYLIPAVAISTVLAVLAAFFISLFFPLKIAGPLYRIEKDLKDHVRNGDLTMRFRLRKGDELVDLAESLNECLQEIGIKIRTVKQAAEELNATVERETGIEDIKKAGRKVSESLNQLKV